VWAHPFWDIDSPDDVELTLRRFAEMGVDGVEAFYPSHGRQQAELLCRVTQELDLLTTGSSDFHGPDHEMFSRFLAFDLYGHEPRLGALAP
jgi:predicted metal-dependent phosphoesterase TrpH